MAQQNNDELKELYKYLGSKLGLEHPAAIDIAAKQFAQVIDKLILELMDGSQKSQRIIQDNLNVKRRPDIGKFDDLLQKFYQQLQDHAFAAKQQALQMQGAKPTGPIPGS